MSIKIGLIAAIRYYLRNKKTCNFSEDLSIKYFNNLSNFTHTQGGI